jgi:hypothetical protein
MKKKTENVGKLKLTISGNTIGYDSVRICPKNIDLIINYAC